MIFYIPGVSTEHRKRPQRIFHTAAVFFHDRMKYATKNGIISSVFNYFSAILGLWGGVFGILEAIDYICDIIY